MRCFNFFRRHPINVVMVISLLLPLAQSRAEESGGGVEVNPEMHPYQPGPSAPSRSNPNGGGGSGGRHPSAKPERALPLGSSGQAHSAFASSQTAAAGDAGTTLRASTTRAGARAGAAAAFRAPAAAPSEAVIREHR